MYVLNIDKMNYIHIKSQDCNYLNDLTSSIEFTLQEPIFRKQTEIFEISLISCVIPYSWYIINSRNNKISVTEDEITTDIYLTNGNYNIREIAILLENALNENTQNNTTYNVSFSKYTNKLTISTDDTEKSTIFDFYYSYEILGFDYWTTYTMTTDVPLTSSNVCNIYADDNVYCRTNLINNSAIDSYSRSATNILQKIEIHVPQGSYIYLNNITTALLSDNKSINSIQLFITDEWDDIINLNGLNWSCTLQIRTIERMPDYYDKMISLKQEEQNTNKIISKIVEKLKK